jgi:hypothetical protein
MKRQGDFKRLVSSLLLIAVGLAYTFRNQDLWVIAAIIGGAVAVVLGVLSCMQPKQAAARRDPDPPVP